LGGDEANFPGELFVEHFRKGREAGWQVTVHAGEISGPESIWQAINQLGARRIGHAVAAIEDPTLMDYMAENEIAVEGNLTSNVQTTTTANYASHPLRVFLEKGMCVTLNTDDPGISGIDLAHEYNVAAPAAGFSRMQIRTMQYNALIASFLSPEEKAALLAKKSSTSD
jgi:adenosine deaminase